MVYNDQRPYNIYWYGDCLSNFCNSTALIPCAYLDNQINYKHKIK